MTEKRKLAAIFAADVVGIAASRVSMRSERLPACERSVAI